MATLPHDNNIDTRILAQIFNNTVATYKFYWFVSILDLVVKDGKRKISFWEIIICIIAEAWYPIHYFRISFGKSDSLYVQIVKIQTLLDIPIDVDKEVLKRKIIANIENTEIKSLLRVFALNVPYRFLSPWIKYTSDKEVVDRSKRFENNCLYAINGESVEINPIWISYLNEHYLIMRDFTFWNLTLFLQKRNPNVPDLSSKLIKPIQRNSLIKQRNFWDQYIVINGSIECIYTAKRLIKREYDLDHFVPWSFVSHNLLWNLLPADGGINSSKSNNLPELSLYLKPFVKIHKSAIETIYNVNPSNKLLEDYLTLYYSIPDFVHLSDEEFYDIFKNTLSPLVQIAENMGFKYWRCKS